MTEQNITENSRRLQANRSYSAKLSWKRKETIALRTQIKEFLEANFDIEMPENSTIFRRMAGCAQNFADAFENCQELIRTYYVLGDFGESVGSLFENGGGEKEVYTNAHTYSKNRIDPVWNWKKSKLIRTVYYRFLQSTRIHEEYTPVHITLTLPHPGGLYKGKKFYARELIDEFNLLRKLPFWKRFVYAGEYGVEVSGGKENGLHIHIHSLAFLHSCHLKQFRELLQKVWKDRTGGSQVWVESLYIYKKGDNGQYITTMKDSKDLTTFEQPDGTYTSTPEGKTFVRKKFYITDERTAIQKSDLQNTEKEKQILDLYTRAILECIKYHFKDESIKLPDGNFNIFLINEILQNTKGKRLYSRYGKFYNESNLNFNQIDKEEISTNEANDSTVINPFTLEEIPVNKTQLVIFKPEHIHYSGKSSINPNTPFLHNLEVYEFMQGKSVKEILKLIIEAKFKRGKKSAKGHPGGIPKPAILYPELL